ncbi:Putative replication protein Rep-3 superfamily [Tenacibaculum maritimum]|uniref:replication initiation protein n=1 Tax=Tenacibaculum maritimum TaxID=107401 RepID=UPI0012E624B2|nr:replication initiation protein [Tenacibaculum maritimum]CAA0229072.1 Putative replication protein Rep-3 superfamily [Tenacibaculum maritimum]
MENSNKIKQPNHVSTARFNYSLTVLEKNIIYTIIDELQKIMSRDLNQKYINQRITVELKTLEQNRNYNRIKNAIKKLGSKHVEFDFTIPKTGKITGFSTSLISGLRHEYNSKFITLNIPEDACRFFCYIGGGFTSFQKTIAISLNSVYSKHLYELCCRWEDKGGYSCTIEELKIYLSISDKYNQIAHLRAKVLEQSKEELKKKADLFFTYSLIKVGRKYSKISFKIHRNTQGNEEYYGIREEHFIYVYNFLTRFFPNYVDNKARSYTDIITKDGYIEKAYYRFIKLEDQLEARYKTKTDIKNILIKSILPEFGISTVDKNQITLKLS